MAKRRRPADPLLRGELSLRHHGVEVRLTTGEGVFSAADVDPGTRYLLRWLATDPAAATARRVLDLGCGYGPIGLWLAAAGADRVVEAVDRDALALECVELGAAANGLADRVTTTASLGYDDVAGGYDLVVSNIPAKIGSTALRHLLLDAFHRLDAGGAVAVVVVDRLAAEVGALLDGEPTVTVADHHRNARYSTWTYGFAGAPAGSEPGPGFERGVYRRGRADWSAGRLRWTAVTSFTLPEFDTLGHGTVAAAELLADSPLPGPVAVVGVGQGHTALAALATGSDGVRLLDRDLLALRTAAANVGPGIETHHTARPAGHLAGCRSAIIVLPEREPVAVTAAVLRSALGDLRGVPVIIHGRAADVARVTDLAGVAVVDDRRARAGHVAVRARFTVTPPA